MSDDLYLYEILLRCCAFSNVKLYRWPSINVAIQPSLCVTRFAAQGTWFVPYWLLSNASLYKRDVGLGLFHDIRRNCGIESQTLPGTRPMLAERDWLQC